MRACVVAIASAAVLLLAGGSARGEDLESLLRESVQQEILRQSDETESTATPAVGFSKETLGRVKHGVWSLIFPGWSQARRGHKSRALGFATAEVFIWSSYIAFQLQGHSREDAYQDFAQRFAGVEDTSQADDYWRAVASFESSDDYNEQVRRAERAGLNEDPFFGDDQAWRWQSETKFSEYRQLRRDSLDSYDRASLVILFAVVNRVVSVIDAVRSGPPDLDAARGDRARTEFFVDVAPVEREMVPHVVLSRSF